MYVLSSVITSGKQRQRHVSGPAAVYARDCGGDAEQHHENALPVEDGKESAGQKGACLQLVPE